MLRRSVEPAAKSRLTHRTNFEKQNIAHFHGTHVPAEEPSTASERDTLKEKAPSAHGEQTTHQQVQLFAAGKQLRDLACVLDEQLRNGTERAILKGDDAGRDMRQGQSDGQDLVVRARR